MNDNDNDDNDNDNDNDDNDINNNDNDINDNNKAQNQSLPWYYAVDDTPIPTDLVPSLPTGLSLDQLQDTIASYCYIANEARIKATYYQHQLQCERTRHSFSQELLERQVKEAHETYENEYKLRLSLENDLKSNRLILYQRNEYLTKQDKIIRSNEEGLDRANDRISSLEEKLEEVGKELKVLKVSYQKEQIDHTLTNEKLSNEINDNEVKTKVIEELMAFKAWADDEHSYLKNKSLSDNNNLLSLSNNYSIVIDRYDELCKHSKLLNKWIEDVLSYIGIAPEIYDTDDQVVMHLLEDSEGGNNSIVAISNEKTNKFQKNMLLIKSMYRNTVLKKQLDIVFDRIERLSNDEINILFIKKKYYQLITKYQISNHFNHFWINFLSTKDNELLNIKGENIKLMEIINDLHTENKKLVVQAIENNTEMLLSTLLKQTEQIKILQANNVAKDKTINRNKKVIEKLKVFENAYNELKTDNDKNIKTVTELRNIVKTLTNTIDNKDAARADENQNSLIMQNLVYAINLELLAFKNLLSYDTEKDVNSQLLQLQEILNGNNKLSTYEKTLITDSASNIATVWDAIENAISFRKAYNNVVSNIQDVSSELDQTKLYSIRETRRMAMLYENKLEELRNNDTTQTVKKTNELKKTISERDQTIETLRTEINIKSSQVDSERTKVQSYLSAYVTSTFIGWVLMFRIITIYFSSNLSLTRKDNMKRSTANANSDEEHTHKHDKHADNNTDNNNDKHTDKEHKQLTNQIKIMQNTVQKLTEENEKLQKDKSTLVQFKQQFIDSLDKGQKVAIRSGNEHVSNTDVSEEKLSKPETSFEKTYASWKLQKTSFLNKRTDKLDKLSPSSSGTTISDSKQREARHIISIQVDTPKTAKPTIDSPRKLPFARQSIVEEE